jgi:hypothetical protein
MFFAYFELLYIYNKKSQWTKLLTESAHYTLKVDIKLTMRIIKKIKKFLSII